MILLLIRDYVRSCDYFLLITSCIVIRVYKCEHPEDKRVYIPMEMLRNISHNSSRINSRLIKRAVNFMLRIYCE